MLVKHHYPWSPTKNLSLFIEYAEKYILIKISEHMGDKELTLYIKISEHMGDKELPLRVTWNCLTTPNFH